MTGKIHSFLSLGTVDGPGVRFVVFMHGCNLSCGYCQNIDAVLGEYKEYSPKEVLDMILKYKEYFSDNGGVTVSGGEPLLQSEFVCELFKLCHEHGIHTALDTSGSIYNDKISMLLDYTDLVLLDIKMCNNSDYEKYIGCSIDTPLKFLGVLNERKVPVYIRQVIVEGINDSEESIEELKSIISRYNNIEKIELLPFKKLCQQKYDNMGLEFPFAKYPQTTQKTIERLYETLKKASF